MIYLDNPNIGESEMLAIQIAMSEGYISTVGPYVTEFETAISNYLGGPYCVATNSGTSALCAALKILGIGRGDEVILPAITFVATANAIKMAGAEPVFVDIDPETWNIDTNELCKAINKKTKAIIPVHLYGNSCNMHNIKIMADFHRFYIIEDACESLGATYNGQHMSTIGDIGCLSFNRNKVITTGGGGMLVTKDLDLDERSRQFINQGRDKTGDIIEPGFNFGMTNQNAALGLSQFKHLKSFLINKTLHNSAYKLLLSDQKNIKFQKVIGEPSFWFTAIKINTQKVGKSISQIQEELKAKGIPTRRIFEPITNFDTYCNDHIEKHHLPNSYDLYNNGLCLPSSTLNTYENIKFVAETLLEVLNN